MCLAVPGRIVRLEDDGPGVTMGIVDFGGVRKPICLAYVPEAVAGDYVIVHVGFAISRLDEEEAAEVFRLLEELYEAGAADQEGRFVDAWGEG